MLSVTRSDPTRFTEWKFLRLKYDDYSRLGGAILMWLPSMQPMMLGISERFSEYRALRASPARDDGKLMMVGASLVTPRE